MNKQIMDNNPDEALKIFEKIVKKKWGKGARAA